MTWHRQYVTLTLEEYDVYTRLYANPGNDEEFLENTVVNLGCHAKPEMKNMIEQESKRRTLKTRLRKKLEERKKKGKV